MPTGPQPDHPPIVFIGGGNMASAIICGATDAGVLDPDRCIVADPDSEKRAGFSRAAASASEGLAALAAMEREPGEGQVVLAVKPQMLPAVADEIADRFRTGPSRVVVSILAGTPSPRITQLLGENARVVRVMPNTPARIGRGISAIAVGEGARPSDAGFASAMMAAVGETVEIEEPMMDAFTALAGSGPAYIFYLAEAMARGGEAVGFSPEDADRIARAVIAGSAELLRRETVSPEELRAAVTSKGGTTAAATAVLTESGLVEIMTRAITAARDRGRELAGA